MRSAASTLDTDRDAVLHATALDAMRQSAAERARELVMVAEISREITSSLDLERVTTSIVNLAPRLASFDRAALALARRGTFAIRALSGAEEVSPNDPSLRDLTKRACWAATRDEALYVADLDHPVSDDERHLAHELRAGLSRDAVKSALYVPLRDEAGCVGVLLFESARADMMTARERELVTILSTIATPAVRNAQAYQRIPLAGLTSATVERGEAFFAMPRARRWSSALVASVAVASLLLIRWPLRISGADPTFRPMLRADVRPTLDGVVDRVFVREGSWVERGAPVVQLRDDELRVRLDAARAASAAADRSAMIAAARGAPAEERLERLRADVLRREADLLDEQVRAATVRAPVSGTVLSARPEERIGTHVDEGDLLVVLGRTDSLELDFGVDQRDVARVHAGSEVRLRVAALPQRTFVGRVVAIEARPIAGEQTVTFPVRALVANDDGLLKPGMAAYARVLAEPASALGRVTRDPLRAARLLWWRIWS